MNPQPFSKPTDAELEILQVLWQYGASSVRLVNEKLNEKREVGYTTTLKMMQVMHEKNLLMRDTELRSHIYAAAIREEDTQKQMLRQFVNATFRGDAMRLVMQALGNHEATDKELEQIKALIKLLENGEG
jgi:predicted transcriptional regulator